MRDNISDSELLNYLFSSGKIESDKVYMEVKAMRINKILEKVHNHKIWKGDNGYWYTYVDSNGKRKLIKKKKEEDIKQYVLDYYGETDKMTLEKMFPLFKENRRQTGVSQKTIDLYDYNFNRFFKDDNIIKKDITKISDDDIEQFIFRTFDKHDIKYKALNEMYSILRNMFKLAMRKKYIRNNPCDYIELIQYKKRCKTTWFDPEERVLGIDDCHRLLKVLRKDFEEKPYYIPTYAVEFMLLTGCRIGEVAFLQWEHIKRDKGYIVICGSEKYVSSTKTYYDDLTKTGKARYIPLTNSLLVFLDHLHAIEESYGFLTPYVFSDKNGRCHLVKLRSCVDHKCKQAKLKATGSNTIRRTFNSILRTNGVSTTIASSILGHTPEVNERHYTYDISNMGYKMDIVEQANQEILGVLHPNSNQNSNHLELVNP